MGDRYNDDRWLWRHDPEDVRRHVRRIAVRADRRADDRTSGSGDRVQLRAVLLAHAGEGEVAQEAAAGVAGRGRETQGASRGHAPSSPAPEAGCRGSAGGSRDNQGSGSAERRTARQAPTQRRQTRRPQPRRI